MNITITILCTNALAGELSHESTIGILLHFKTHTHVTHRTINWSQRIFKGHEFMVRQSQSKALTGSALLACLGTWFFYGAAAAATKNYSWSSIFNFFFFLFYAVSPIENSRCVSRDWHRCCCCWSSINIQLEFAVHFDWCSRFPLEEKHVRIGDLSFSSSSSSSSSCGFN